jgi:Na+/H+ antiporter NhaD/arsenite permease-like protein
VLAAWWALASTSAVAAEVHFDGRALSLGWALPFAGLILSIALVPLFSQKFWHHHYGKFALAWALVFAVPFAYTFGLTTALHEIVHTILREYIPFVVVLFALFAIAGGICIHGRIAGTPARNTALLATGATLASVMGTTGASMLLIRPLIAGNEERKYQAHAVVFFILLAGNIGGALSPLGDPPLFIGYLKGVDFFWTTRNLLAPTIAITVVLLVVFFVLDTYFARREAIAITTESFRIEGKHNFILLAGVIGAVLMSGTWKPNAHVTIVGIAVPLQALVREALLVALALVSLAITPRAVREHNVFHWGPIVEVAKLFAGIFVTIIPVLAMLQASREGALAPVVQFVSGADGEPSDVAVFWLAGLLSALLDNAPTYLVFFDLAGGDAKELMGSLSTTLAAISMGAVYFGALTYNGNAPNFMIKAIAEDRGIAMPTFFAYILYAAALLLPLLAAVAYLAL